MMKEPSYEILEDCRADIGPLGNDEEIIERNNELFSVEEPISRKENLTNFNFGVWNHTLDA